ncbi:MAG: hypothetical protein RI972_2140, partial [Pseudomonadota bacterium]
MSRDHQDRLPSDDEGHYFKPFDADQPLLARCGCGKDHTVAQHQAEAAATGSLLAAGEHTARASQPALGNASQDLERFSAEFIEASMVKAIFPHEPTRRSLIKALGAGTLRAAVAAALP